MPRDADGVYTRKDRPGYWIQWIDAQGKRRIRKTNANSLSAAKHARSAEIIRVEQSKALGFAPPTEDLFQEVAKTYLAHQKARLSSEGYERERGIFEKHLKPYFACKVRSIRRIDVQRYITERLSKNAQPDTVRKELNVLKHFLKLCVEWEVIPINPATGVKGPSAPAGRVRYLQETEVEIVLNACPEWLRPIATLAVFTGMRRSEILNLRWLDVDLVNGRVLLPQTKNGDGRIVYLNQSAQAVFRGLASSQQSATEKVFKGIDGRQVSMAFMRACRRVGISDFRFHDTRHTAASWMRMHGADIHTVAQILGHKDLRMAMRYQHLSPEHLAKAVAGLDALNSAVAPVALPEKKGVKRARRASA